MTCFLLCVSQSQTNVFSFLLFVCDMSPSPFNTCICLSVTHSPILPKHSSYRQVDPPARVSSTLTFVLICMPLCLNLWLFRNDADRLMLAYDVVRYLFVLAQSSRMERSDSSINPAGSWQQNDVLSVGSGLLKQFGTKASSETHAWQ